MEAMNHAELHHAVRALIDGRGYPFYVGCSSSEYHPGRVEVDWTITIFIGPSRSPKVHVRAKTAVFALMRATELFAEHAAPKPPDELATINGPPPVATVGRQ
jgi:hypothetical protein